MRLFRITRRELLLAGLGTATAFGVGVAGGFLLGRRSERRRRIVPPRAQPFAPGPFVAIDETGIVAIWLSKTDMGQGVSSALPILLADELGADPANIRVIQAQADDAFGSQLTAVSTSVRGMFAELRLAGAAAREMLIRAASDALGVSAEACRAELSQVLHPSSGRRLGFGSLVRAAARLPVPVRPTLQPLDRLRHVGKRLPRLDLPAKVNGTARFGIDVRVAGMAFATVARCPTPGGKPLRYRETAARAVPGVLDVLTIERGVAVIASNSHAAILGQEALETEWDRGPHAVWDAGKIDAHLDSRLLLEGAVARRDGHGASGLEGPGEILRADFRLPYLAHATMEPMNCTADVRDGECTIWAPTQSPQGARDAVARRMGVHPAKIAVNVTLAGGGFGRRVANDFILEAVDLSKAVRRPLQVLWTRTDDLQHDLYRPCSLHRLEARLDASGLPVAWRHRVVAPSILAADPNFRGAIDKTAVEGAQEIPYRISDLQVEYVRADLPIPIWFWRSVGHSYNAYAVESFIDEIARAGGRDPVELRRELLASSPRHLAVLNEAVARAGSSPSAPGSGRGIAIHACFGSYVAMVADITANGGGQVRVRRVICAVDCGFAVDPDGVAAQIEGGVIFGLTAALYGRIDFRDGAPLQSNFHDYRLLRMGDAPEVEVYLVRGSQDTPGGVGEIGVPPIAPALCNALYAATGKRVRTLPILSSLA